MGINEACNTLIYYNKWRRGADIPMPSATKIGVAIDEVIKYCKDNGIECDQACFDMEERIEKANVN